MKKAMLLALVAALVSLSTGAARSEPAPVPSGGAPPSAAELRNRLSAAGIAVPKDAGAIAAEDFELAALAGGKLKLSSFRGSVVYLNFWATWCPPCRAEMPSMERLYTRLKDKGLEIVAVDLQESKDQVQKFVKENKLTFTVLLDSSGTVGSAYGAQSIPTTYLVDRRGMILGRSIGGREWDSPDMLALFEAVLAAK